MERDVKCGWMHGLVAQLNECIIYGTDSEIKKPWGNFSKANLSFYTSAKSGAQINYRHNFACIENWRIKRLIQVRLKGEERGSPKLAKHIARRFWTTLVWQMCDFQSQQPLFLGYMRH